MSAMTIRVLPADAARRTGGLQRGLAAFLLLASILVVFFAGTFPFDFSFPSRGIFAQIQRTFDTRWHPYDPNWSDRLQNIIFFVPLGIGVASVVLLRRNRIAWRIGIAFAAGAALSTLVECLQTFVSFRDPSWADIWCNTLGATLGATLFCAGGDDVLRRIAQEMQRLRPFVTAPVLIGLVIAYGAVHLSLPLIMRNAGDLSVWDTAMPLLVGNELSGDRGWSGIVNDIALADRAVGADAILALCKGAAPADVFGENLLCSYKLTGKPPIPDATGNLPPLNWAGAPSELESMLVLSPQNWLKTAGPVVKANHRIARSSQFTIAATAGTLDIGQRDPAPLRIVSISSGVSSINLQIGQDEHDLVVRVRTAARGMPSLYVRNVFADTMSHHLAVTAKDAQIIIYVDGYEQGRCEITPEAKLMWRLYPRNANRIRIEHYGYRSYALMYRLLVLIPFAALLGAALMQLPWPRRTKRLAAAGAIGAFVLAMEMLLGVQSASGFQFVNLIWSLLIAGGTLSLLAWWRASQTRR